MFLPTYKGLDQLFRDRYCSSLVLGQVDKWTTCTSTHWSVRAEHRLRPGRWPKLLAAIRIRNPSHLLRAGPYGPSAGQHSEDRRTWKAWEDTRTGENGQDGKRESLICGFRANAFPVTEIKMQTWRHVTSSLLSWNNPHYITFTVDSLLCEDRSDATVGSAPSGTDV